MRGCWRLLAALVAAVFVGTAAAALLLVPLVQVVTDRESLTDALAGMDQALLDAAAPLVTAAIESRLQQLAVPGLSLDPAMVQAGLQQLMPPGWLAAQTETAVDAVFDALESGQASGGQPPAVALQLDTAPLLDRLRQEPGREAVAALVAGIPPCTDPAVLPDLGAGDLSLPACIPPGVPRQTVTEQLHGLLVQAVDQNPQWVADLGRVTIPLAPLAADTSTWSQTRARLQRWLQAFRLARAWAWLVWLLPAGCLLLLLLLAVHSPADLGLWWGGPLLVSGLLALLAMLLLPALYTFWLRTALPSTTDGPGTLLAVAVTDSVLAAWQGRVLLQAGAALLLGLLLALVGLLAGRRPPHPA